MKHVVDETTAEGEGFNFNQWLIDNDFSRLKDLFIKHEAITETALQISSSEMQNLLADPEFLSQPQMVPKVFMAIHQLAVVQKVVTMVLSEKEQAVIDRIQRELEAVDRMDEKVTTLITEYPKSQKLFESKRQTQIQTVTAEINATFDALFARLNQRKQHLLDQLYEIQTKHDEDQKFDDELLLRSDDIDDLRTFLKEKEAKYHKLVSAEKDDAERKKLILQIEQDVNTKVLEIKKCIERSTNSVKAQMSKHERECETKSIITKGAYYIVIAAIGRLGTITSPSDVDSRTPESHFICFPEITVDVDWENEEQKFEHLPVSAWRFDTEQYTWTERGLGKIILYWNKDVELLKLVFIDEKQEKVRLLQWISGGEMFEHSSAQSSCGIPELNKHFLKWFAADYAMDQTEPTTGSWGLDFLENEDAASRCAAVFNDVCSDHMGTTDYIFRPHQEVTRFGRYHRYQHICISNDRFTSKCQEELMFEDRKCEDVQGSQDKSSKHKDASTKL